MPLMKSEAYTVTACPPNVYSMLVAPVKYNTSFVGAECVTFPACICVNTMIGNMNIIISQKYSIQGSQKEKLNKKKMLLYIDN